jgi:hypothetical protein
VIVNDAELTPYGEVMLDPMVDCDFCGRSMISRFGGLIGANECDSCINDFNRLNQAGKLELIEAS